MTFTLEERATATSSLCEETQVSYILLLVSGSIGCIQCVVSVSLVCWRLPPLKTLFYSVKLPFYNRCVHTTSIQDHTIFLVILDLLGALLHVLDSAHCLGSAFSLNQQEVSHTDFFVFRVERDASCPNTLLLCKENQRQSCTVLKQRGYPEDHWCDRLVLLAIVTERLLR